MVPPDDQAPSSSDAPPPHEPTRADADASSDPEIDWRSTHLWQIQPVRDVLLVLLVFGVLYLGKVLSVVTVPLLLALLLAYLFEPVVRWLCKRSERINRSAAATIIIVAVLLVGMVAASGLAYGVAQGYVAARNLVVNVAEVREAVAEVAKADAAAREAEQAEAEQTEFEQAQPDATSAEAAEAATPASAPSDASPEPETPDPASTPVVDSPEPAEPAPGSAADLRAQADRLLAARRGALPSDLWRELFDSTLEAVEAFDDDDVLASSPLLSFLNQAAAAINPAADPVRGVLRPTVRAGAEVISATLSFSGKVVLLLMGAFFTGFFFFFISTGYPAVVDRLRSFIPEKHRDRTTDLATKFDAVINGFIRGRLTVAFVLGAFLSIAYFLIGVPGAFIVGPIIGVLSIAPYVSLVGIPISILLLLLDPSGFFSFQSHWLWAIAAPTVVYFIAQALDDYVLTPIIQGKATNMDTPTILFATLAGGALAGIYGVLLAIPVAACAKIALTELFWPRFKAWTEGKERDFLPISRD